MKRVLSTVSILVFIITIVFIVAVLTIPCTPVYAEETESECWAVIVGVSDYQYIEDLSYADNDAQSLANQLSSVWGDDHVKILTDGMATRQDIGDAITNWLDPRENADDTVLFFFSGHGSHEYICPYDSLLTSYANDISQYNLASWLDRLESRRMIVIIDSCHSGSFIYAVSDSDRVILASSTANETSWESDSYHHSVFTHFILQVMDEFSSGDINGDHNLSAEEIYYYAAPEVAAWAAINGESQHPVISDEYHDELVVLIEFIFNVEPQSLHSIDVLFVDDNAYSGSTELILAPGSIHNIRVIPIHDAGIGTRYVFTSWGDGNTSASRVVSDGGEYKADYRIEHWLTVESVYGAPEGEGWYDEGSTASISVVSVEEPTIRHIFTGWSGDYTGNETTASVVMYYSTTITANWRNEYLLTIESAYSEPEGQGWYDEGTTATISVSERQGMIIRRIFTGWSGDFNGNTATASFTVNSPMVVTANWRTDYLQLYMIIIGIIVILGVFGCWLTIRRKRLARISLKETTQPPTSPMRCANCGAELEPGDAFCIKCGQPVKDN